MVASLSQRESPSQRCVRTWKARKRGSLETGKLYYSQDGLGSVRALTDGAGVVQNRYDYSAFGEAYAPGTSVTVSQRYTYTGREKSAVSGAPMYYRYRMYAPNQGRFTARDPAGYRNNTYGNLYDYVGNFPNVLVDPSGLDRLPSYRWQPGQMKEEQTRPGEKRTFKFKQTGYRKPGEWKRSQLHSRANEKGVKRIWNEKECMCEHCIIHYVKTREHLTRRTEGVEHVWTEITSLIQQNQLQADFVKAWTQVDPRELYEMGMRAFGKVTTTVTDEKWRFFTRLEILEREWIDPEDEEVVLCYPGVSEDKSLCYGWVNGPTIQS